MTTSQEVYSRALSRFGNHEQAREATTFYPGDFITEDDVSCERCDDYGCSECESGYDCDKCHDRGCSWCEPDCSYCSDRGCERCEPDL